MAQLEHGDQAPRGVALGPRYPLGREAGRRFAFARWGRPGRRQVAGPLGLGSLAARTSRFVAVVGRSTAERLGAGQHLGWLGAGPWPLRRPEEHLPLAGERRRSRVSVPAAERQARSWEEIERRLRGVPAKRPDRRPPPAVLPRASSRAGQSRAGQGTGPAGAAQRMRSEPVFVANPKEVRAAGGTRLGHNPAVTAPR